MQNSFFTRFFSSRRAIVATILGVCALAGIAFYFASRHSMSLFTQEYLVYQGLAQEQENAAYTPAAPNNPIRQELNLALSEALQNDTKSARRVVDAQQGLAFLAQLEKEVDAIGDTSETANTQLAKMQVNAVNDFSASGASTKIIELAKQRSEIIEDIRGLSYRADFETEKILNHIVDSNGVLTPEYIDVLNNELPDVETQFDKRAALYTQLSAVSSQIDALASSIGIPAASSTAQ